MKNNSSLIYSVLLVIGDFFALVIAFSAAYILRVSLNHTPISTDVRAFTYIGLIATLLPFFLIIFALLGLYTPRIYGSRFGEFGRLIPGCFIGMLGVISYAYIANVRIFPARLVTVYGFFLAFIFVLGFRTAARGIRRSLFRFGIGIASVLIVGDTKVTATLLDVLADTNVTGYRVVGIVGFDHHKLEASRRVRHFDDFQSAVSGLTKRPNIIIQTELYAAGHKNDEIVEYAQEHHLDYRFVPGNSELFVGKIEAELFHSIPVIAVHQTALVGWGRVAKRAVDLSISTLAIIILSPVMLLTALAIKLFGGGSVFFRQIRLTRGDRPFKVFKFRSQYPQFDGTTPEQAFEMIGKPELASAYRQNGDFLPNDPRITPVGRFIRKWSIDELPQLFNVFLGDISLVGPRALIPQELAQYNKRHAILSVKSGITGLAQVSGRRNISFEERRKLDLYYVQNWSFWGDIVILARTIWITLTGKGAE